MRTRSQHPEIEKVNVEIEKSYKKNQKEKKTEEWLTKKLKQRL